MLGQAPVRNWVYSASWNRARADHEEANGPQEGSNGFEMPPALCWLERCPNGDHSHEMTELRNVVVKRADVIQWSRARSVRF